MSEIYCEIMLYHENAEAVEALRDSLSPSGKDQERPFGSYTVESGMVDDHVIIASIAGLLDIDLLMVELTTTDPDWLYVTIFDSKTGHEEAWCFRKGKKKTTLKTLSNAIRKKSRAADLYFAIADQEKDKLASFLKDKTLSLDMVIDGAPLLYHILAMGSLRLMKLAVQHDLNLHEKVAQTRWIESRHGAFQTFEAVRGMNLLSIAVLLQAAPMVKFLVEQGLDVNAEDENGNTPLCLAAEERTMHKLIEPLIEAGADINHQNHKGYTPLMILLEGNEYNAKKTIAVAEKWIALGADIKRVCPDGTNALWLVMNKDQALIDFVQSKGVTEYIVPEGLYDDMPLAAKLERALWKNDVPSFKSYLKPDDLSRQEQAELLHKAAAQGRLKIIRILIEQGVPPYLMRRGFFAHQIASHERQREAAHYLKEQMDDFFARQKEGIAAARPWFDKLMTTLTDIGNQVATAGASKSVDLSALKPFEGDPFMRKFTPEQLTHWAYASTLYQNKRLSSWMDDKFNIYFQKGELPEGMTVKISVEENPQVLDIGKDI